MSYAAIAWLQKLKLTINRKLLNKLNNRTKLKGMILDPIL
jgi:hypothetical protein